MITKDTVYNVKNRSTSMVVYRVPELNLRREFAPGETKRIKFDELEKLTFQPGGREMIENFLQILDEVVTKDLNVHRELEYDMSEKQVESLIKYGSLDAFLDALDFAPIGVIDLIKMLSVQIPLSDISKRRALFDKTGFDVDSAIRHLEEEKAEANEQKNNAAPGTRRVKQEETTVPAQPQRRTTPDYKVTKMEE